MSSDVGEATEGLENDMWRRWSDGKIRECAELVLQLFRHFTYVTAHSPTLPSLYLRHSSFYNPWLRPRIQNGDWMKSVSKDGFTYVTAHSPTLLSLLLRHRLFTYVTWRAAHDVKNWWYRRGPVSGIYLFARGHVLHLRSETVAVLRRMNMMWMINVVHMIRGDECGPNFLTFASQ